MIGFFKDKLELRIILSALLFVSFLNFLLAILAAIDFFKGDASARYDLLATDEWGGVEGNVDSRRLGFWLGPDLIDCGRTGTGLDK